jgi:hypothetical protein
MRHLDIVRHYTREDGVRNLEREVAKIGRKAVKQLLLDKKNQKQVTVTPKNLEKFLGVKPFRSSARGGGTANARDNCAAKSSRSSFAFTLFIRSHAGEQNGSVAGETGAHLCP